MSKSEIRKSEAHDDPLAKSLLHLLHRAGQTADELFAREMKATHLTPRQFAVLVVLARNETASQTAIVDATGIDRSTSAEIVKRLVDRGLLARRRSKLDARAYAVKLTAEGQAVLKQAVPIASRLEESLLAALPSVYRSAILQGLAAITKNPT